MRSPRPGGRRVPAKTTAHDVAFAQAWDRWFQEHPQHEVPPALVVVTGVDRPEFGGGWKISSDEFPLHERRESLIRAQFDSLRSLLSPTFHDFAAVGLGDETPAGVIEHVLPALTPLLMRAAHGPAPASSRSRRPLEGRPPDAAARRTRPLTLGQPEGPQQGRIDGAVTPCRRRFQTNSPSIKFS